MRLTSTNIVVVKFLFADGDALSGRADKDRVLLFVVLHDIGSFEFQIFEIRQSRQNPSETEKTAERPTFPVEGSRESALPSCVLADYLNSVLNYAAWLRWKFSIRSVPSGFAVMRVRQSFWTISAILPSALTSQTRLLLRLRNSVIAAPPFLAYS